MGMWVGRGRKARAAYGFDDIALVPGSLTINPNEVDISWELCGRRFQIPIMAAAMDGVVSPKLAIEMGRLGGLAVLNLEGVFSRYENPDEVLDRIVSASQDEATKIISGCSRRWSDCSQSLAGPARRCSFARIFTGRTR